MRKLLLMVGLLTFFLSACGGPLEVEVTFETNGGSKISSMIFNEESTFTLPNDPTKEGFTFGGWYLDETLNNPFSVEGVLALEPEGTLTIYASWTINAYSLILTSVYHETIETTVEYMAEIQLPELSHEGYRFLGWYLDDDFSNKISIDKMPSQSLNLYAKFEMIYENEWRTYLIEKTEDTIIISIQVIGYVDFSGFDASLKYDNSSLSIKSIDNHLGSVLNSNKEGEIVFNYVDALDPIQSEVLILTITFEIMTSSVEIYIEMVVRDMIQVDQNFDILKAEFYVNSNIIESE